jgi:tetratricopeptide (TPR) repeat protein
LLELGVACRWLGEAGQAEQALSESIRLFGETGDFTGQAQAEVEIGQLYETTGQTAPAYEAYQRAVAAAQRHAAFDLRRRALNGLAGLALHNKRTDAALDLLQQALTLGADRPDGRTLSNLGMAYLQAEDIARAIDYQQQALDAFEDDGALPEQARAHLRLGMAYHAGERAADALHHLDAGLRLMQTLGDALGRARILTNLGAVYAGAERWQEALSVWREALDLQHQLGDAVGMAYTWYNLADLQWQLDRPAEARAALDQAAALAEQRDLVTLLASIHNHPARRG